MAASNIFKELEKGSFAGLKRSISLYPSAVNLKNTAGLTPLHIAAQQGQAAFVKELLVHGAQHDTTDPRGNIPLHQAAEQGNVETVVELLAGRKASVKAKNKEGQTPLHVAVIGGHKAVVLKLLETGIQADALKDKAGRTPQSLVDPDDVEMQQIFADARPLSSAASINQGLAPLPSFRGSEASPAGTTRVAAALGAAAPIAGNSGRIAMAPSPSFGRGQSEATPGTPPPRGGAGGTPGGARTPAGSGGGGRTPPPAPSHGGALTSRLPKNAGSVAASPAQSGGGAAPEQLHKHDLAIQSLKEGLRAASERLGALDACTAAQLECAGQVEKALEACGNHGRAILDLEARVAFQEDRGRDTRGRLERLEEGERDRQDSVKRLTDDQRSLHTQLQRLADQVTANGSGPVQRHSNSADAASHLQGNPHLQAELAVLRAQVDQLSPALALATAASAEVRTLAVRLDVMQQQFQQHQQQSAVAAQQPHLGTSVVLEQQVLQLQAQVQLLQLPVANLTQQCADMAGRVAGFTEWQQQARADLAKLVEAAAASAQQDAGSRRSAELTDAVMGVLDTASKTLQEHRQQIDAVDKKVALLMQERDQQQAAVPASPPPPSGPPTLPATPQSASQRVSGAGDTGMGPFGGPPSRNLTGPPSMARDTAAQAEVRAELESLKSLVADIRKEVATEGGSLRREWQRAFSDMQSRYGEQTNELRAREANIAKLREAALVEEAERRAASGIEDKFSARLGKLETNVEYLTHRLEVLEEQLSGVMTSLAGAPSPVLPTSPSRMAAALAALRGQPAPTRSGPGPVSENHNGFVAATSDLLAVVAAASAVASPRVVASPKQGRYWSTGGPASVAASPGGTVMQSDGGCLRMRLPLFGAVGGAKDPGLSPAGGGADCAATVGSAATSAREARSARDASDRKLGPEEWWRAADAEALEIAAAPAAAAAELLASAQGTGGGAGPSLPLPPAVSLKADGAAAEVMAAGPAAASGPQHAAEAAAVAGQRPEAAATAVVLPSRETAGDAGRSPAPAVPLLQPQGVSSSAACSRATREGAASMPGLEPAAPALCGPVDPRGPSSARETSVMSAPEPLLSARGNALPAVPIPQLQQQPPGVGLDLLDPTNVALGPQLLTPMAHALLAPSVDIQRLAAATAAQQQQQQLQHYSHPVQQQPFMVQPPPPQQQQQNTPAMQLWGGQQQALLAGQLGNPAVGVQGPGGVLGSGRPAAAPPDGRGGAQASDLGSGSGPARKEPPLCLFCPMQ